MKRRTVLQSLSAFGAWAVGLFSFLNPWKVKTRPQLASTLRVDPGVPWVRVDPPIPTVVRFEGETQEGLIVMRLTNPAVKTYRDVNGEWEKLNPEDQTSRLVG